MSNTYKSGFNWAAEFEKCESYADLRVTGKQAAEHIAELEAELATVRSLATQLVNIVLYP